MNKYFEMINQVQGPRKKMSSNAKFWDLLRGATVWGRGSKLGDLAHRCAVAALPCIFYIIIPYYNLM